MHSSDEDVGEMMGRDEEGAHNYGGGGA
jgi:hypothetical protein